MFLTSRSGSRTGGARRTLLQRCRHNLLGKVQILSEVLDALCSKVPVEVLPVGRKSSHSSCQIRSTGGKLDQVGGTYHTPPQVDQHILVLSISPVEGFSHKPARLHRLHKHQHLQVGHILDLIVLGLEEIFLGHKDAFLEEVGVNR